MENQPLTFTTPGIALVDGALVVADVELSLQPNSEVSGYGLPMTIEAGRELILRYHRRLSSRLAKVRSGHSDETEADVMKETICVSMGRETLLRILSQEGCEGIRLYFAEGCEERTFGLVAIGINKYAHEIGLDSGNKSIVQPNSLSNRGGSDDCNPPFTLKDLEDLKRGSLPRLCHEDINTFIEKTPPDGLSELAGAILGEFNKL